MTTTAEKPSKSLQLWPGGQSVRVRGEGKDMEIMAAPENTWRAPTDEEYKKVRIEEDAERYADREIWCCDSMLIDALMKTEEMSDEFSYEKVSNLRPDPSGWTLEQCKEWLEDEGHGLPDPNPWGMDANELAELASGTEYGPSIEDPELAGPDLLEKWRAEVVQGIDDEAIAGLDDWRQEVSDQATDAEVYEWWRVSDWLATQLGEVGECVLDNDYGQWWGRTCTGQGLIMDGSIQKVAARILEKYGY